MAAMLLCQVFHGLSIYWVAYQYMQFWKAGGIFGREGKAYWLNPDGEGYKMLEAEEREKEAKIAAKKAGKKPAQPKEETKKEDEKV